ncbi:MAG: ATP synthase F1 subunit epsilon [Planctomycetota bacterium]|nr:MAG: ATP synthase F1 subunit epsilon [Planctomycetota bacterium]
MSEKSFTCSVITPERQVYESEVDSVVIPAHDGEMGILFNHAPLICKLGTGAMRVRKGNDQQAWFLDAGFVQVIENRVIVLAQRALRSDQIDRDQAEGMLAEARAMKVTDEISYRNKVHAQAVARAQLRITGK